MTRLGIRDAIAIAHDCFMSEVTTDTPRPSDADIEAARRKLAGESLAQVVANVAQVHHARPGDDRQTREPPGRLRAGDLSFTFRLRHEAQPVTCLV